MAPEAYREEKWERHKRYTAHSCAKGESCTDGNELFHWTRYPPGHEEIPVGVLGQGDPRMTRGYDFNVPADVLEWAREYGGALTLVDQITGERYSVTEFELLVVGPESQRESQSRLEDVLQLIQEMR